MILVHAVMGNLEECSNPWRIQVSGNLGSTEISCLFEVKHTSPLGRSQDCSSIFLDVNSDKPNYLPDIPKELKVGIIKQPLTSNTSSNCDDLQHRKRVLELNLTWEQYDVSNSQVNGFGGFLLELTTIASQGNRSCFLFYGQAELNLRTLGRKKVFFSLAGIPVAAKRVKTSIWTLPWQGTLTDQCHLADRQNGCRFLVKDHDYLNKLSLGSKHSTKPDLPDDDAKACHCFSQNVVPSLVGNELEVIYCPVYKFASRYVIEVYKFEHSDSQGGGELYKKKTIPCQGQKFDCTWKVGPLVSGFYYQVLVRHNCRSEASTSSWSSCPLVPTQTHRFRCCTEGLLKASTQKSDDNGGTPTWLYVMVGCLVGTIVSVLTGFLYLNRRNPRGISGSSYYHTDNSQIRSPKPVMAVVAAVNTGPSVPLLPRPKDKRDRNILLVFTVEDTLMATCADKLANILKICGCDSVHVPNTDNCANFCYDSLDEVALKQSLAYNTIVIMLSGGLVELMGVHKNSSQLEDELQSQDVVPVYTALLLQHIKQRFYNPKTLKEKEKLFVLSLNSYTETKFMAEFVKKHFPFLPPSNKLIITGEASVRDEIKHVLSSICHGCENNNIEFIMESSDVKTFLRFIASMKKQ
ncbi:hypothetical protein ScPMuIL_008790 [Solemya velum]